MGLDPLLVVMMPRWVSACEVSSLVPLTLMSGSSGGGGFFLRKNYHVWVVLELVEAWIGSRLEK